MTIDFREGIEVANKEESLYGKFATENYINTTQNNFSNMMRPMPFSGYPFQGMLLLF